RPGRALRVRRGEFRWGTQEGRNGRAPVWGHPIGCIRSPLRYTVRRPKARENCPAENVRCPRVRWETSSPGGPARLRLDPLDYQLQNLARPPRQRVHPLRLGRPTDARGENVLTAQRHGPAGEGDGVQQPIVVDLAQAGAAVLVRRREVAVVLDA